MRVTPMNAHVCMLHEAPAHDLWSLPVADGEDDDIRQLRFTIARRRCAAAEPRGAAAGSPRAR